MTGVTTLPDLLKPGLDLVFAGINPGTYSARAGHYYARPGNLFWWALAESGLANMPVGPEDDASLLEQGIGFTDVAKRLSGAASDLSKTEFHSGAAELLKKIRTYAPLVVCFNGLTGFAYCFGERARPGRQEVTIDFARVYVVPSTSRRNAHYQRDDVLCWFRGLKSYLDCLREATVGPKVRQGGRTQG